MHNTKECFALKKGNKKTNRQWLLATIYGEKKDKTRAKKKWSLYTLYWPFKNHVIYALSPCNLWKKEKDLGLFNKSNSISLSPM